MFVRNKKNLSCTITFVVVIKNNGKFKEIPNLEIVKTQSEADDLMLEGKNGYPVKEVGKQGSLDLFTEEKIVSATEIFNSISQISQYGAYRLLEKLYDSIGFGSILTRF